MSFALVGFQARSLEVSSPSKVKAVQQVVMNITAAATDVDLDIGDASGTFWTDALADGTYGDLASSALTSLTEIAGQSSALVAVQSEQLIDRVQSAAAGNAGEYALAIDAIGPNITFHAADGDTAYKIILVWELDAGIGPITASYGSY